MTSLQFCEGASTDKTPRAALPFAMASYLGRYLLSGQDRYSEYQVDRLRVLKLPDYFAWFKGHPTDLAPFLGGCLAAKVSKRPGMLPPSS